MNAMVVVPTYNERDNVAAIAERLLAALPGSELLFVDDNSPDGTGAILDEIATRDRRVHVLHRAGKLGLGTAYVEGFGWGLARGYELLFEMDADFSHDPADIPRLVDAARDADLVIGSRYVRGGRLQNWPWRRRALSRFANTYVRTITRLPLADCTSGFRCWRRELLARLPLGEIVSEGYAFLVEMVWQARRAHGRIAEIPIVFVERRAGASKMSLGVMAESAVLPWRLIARPRHDTRPPRE